jgi:hypothetical protein
MAMEARVVGLDVAKMCFTSTALIVGVKQSYVGGFGDPKLPSFPATNSKLDRYRGYTRSSLLGSGIPSVGARGSVAGAPVRQAISEVPEKRCHFGGRECTN